MMPMLILASITQEFLQSLETGKAFPCINCPSRINNIIDMASRITSYNVCYTKLLRIHTSCAYPPTSLDNTLGEWMAKHDKTQLRISETEKYAHVTFFFNGGVEDCFPGEDRVLIPSPKVATYDLQPEMSSVELTDKLVDAIRNNFV